MCGIVGYVGGRDSSQVLINGLKSLEYRGYDSAGIAVFDSGRVRVVKTEGRLSGLVQKLREQPFGETHCGIGHTRWATHGEPSYENAHPHRGTRVTVVHNGIIENAGELRQRLEREGVAFASQTDTEAVVHLLDAAYHGDPFEAIHAVTQELRGAYALGVLFHDKPGMLFALRKDSPLVIGLGEGEQWIASDIPAILPYTRRYLVLKEGETALLKADGVTVRNSGGAVVKKKTVWADWNVEMAEKGGFDHFMLKEIYEQPEALKRTVSAYLASGTPDFSAAGLSDALLQQAGRVHMVACGTAMHAGMLGKYVLEQFARVPCDVHVASEFRYSPPVFGKQDMVLVISQSGETADSLAALRLAGEKGLLTVGIVNAVGSSIAREADVALATLAGPEIAVASTKAYTVQVGLLYLLALRMAYVRGEIDRQELCRLCEELLRVPAVLEQALIENEACRAAARVLAPAANLFYIGRGIDDALAKEGALKLKEVSYIHCEAIAAGELKHGTISLIEQGTPVVAVATEERLLPKLLSSIQEVKARGAKVLVFYKEGLQFLGDPEEMAIVIPRTEPLFMPLPTVVLLQLLAYYTALERGTDVDKPRNLAKSVTVE